MTGGLATGGNEPRAKVAIIVLNWNGWRDTIECLESLQTVNYPDYEVIVVDNGSTDDSAERIKAWARGDIPVSSRFLGAPRGAKPVSCLDYGPDLTACAPEGMARALEQAPPASRLVMVRTGRNLGFAGGSNVGVKLALRRGRRAPEYVLLLNNDTVVAPDAVTVMVNGMAAQPRIGICGAKIRYYADPTRLWFSGGKLGFLRSTGYHVGLGRRDRPDLRGMVSSTFVTGCAMLIRKRVFDTVPLLDERYFLSVEDVDYCWRAAKSGWLLATQLDAVIYHKVSASRGGEGSAREAYYIARNRMFFSSRHHTPIQRLAFQLFWAGTRLIRFAQWLVGGRVKWISESARGVMDFKAGRMGERP